MNTVQVNSPKWFLTNHLEDEKEGGARCSACFNTRLDLVAQKAQELGYDYFGSALTISPKKNSSLDQSNRNGYPKDLRDTIFAK